MKIDKEKFEVELARRCLSSRNLKGVSPQTVAKIRRGGEVRPAALGRVARALGVDVTEIMEVKQ
ncbi:helix-turn-helix transcriptional regulator [Neobittarella massiliensis]|uniref:helix-turn-helix domain-containing protein n=1 Tax=Neobittarella massiliensis (ex Bilen et al. 2018) TaxID=2041842 RepID=UPI000CF69F41|nr:helix-turn-helix domain-containing protein [Neobittarella massiliensis]